MSNWSSCTCWTLQAAQAEARGDDAACGQALARREAFLREHAARWMPAFADEFAGSTREPAFRAAAALLWFVADLR